MDLNQLLLDEKKAEKGVWVSAGDGVEVLVGSFDNPSYEKAIVDASRKYRGTPDGIPRDDLIKITCKHVFLGFRGITNNGEPFEDTLDHRIYLLKNSPEIDRIVSTSARSFALFRRQAEEAEEKNS